MRSKLQEVMDHLTETHRCCICHKRKKCLPANGRDLKTGYNRTIWVCDPCYDRAKDVEDEHDRWMEQEAWWEGTRE